MLPCVQIFRKQYEGRTFSVTGIQGNYYKAIISTNTVQMFDYFSVLNASTTDTSMGEPVAETSSLSLPQNLAVFTNWTGH